MSNMISIHDLPKVLLFYDSGMENLANSIAEESKVVQLGRIHWETREDGALHRIEIQDAYKVKGAIVMFLTNFGTPAQVIQQFAAMSKLPRLGPRTFKILCPSFPSLTLRSEGGERGSGKKGEVYTATTLSRLISGLPKAKSGPTEIVIWDIHHLQERFYFEDSVIARLENSMEILVSRLDREIDFNMSQYHTMTKGRPRVVWVEGKPVELPSAPKIASTPILPPPPLKELMQLPLEGPGVGVAYDEDPATLLKLKIARRKADPNASAVAFPSERSSKRFKRYFPGFDIIICTTYAMRGGRSNETSIMEGDPKNRRVVLVDDVIYSGNTLLNAAKLLKERGASRVSIYATHGVFTNDSWKKFLGGDIDEIMVTDSCPRQATVLRAYGYPFEVMSLAPLIAPIVDEEAFLFLGGETSETDTYTKGGNKLLPSEMRSRL